MAAVKRTWRARMISILSLLALAYLALMILVAAFQRHLIYIPSRISEETALLAAPGEGLEPWRSPAGTLIGWRAARSASAGKAQNRLVLFHGNAGAALHRSYYIDGFRAVPGGETLWDIYLFEYPGYGATPGSPSEDAILKSARDAIKALLDSDPSPIFLAGESLGGSFATRLAAENLTNVAGLLLVTPFTRIADVATHHYGFLPVRLLLRERHEVEDTLRIFPGPVAFVLAGRDEVIPPAIGRRLYEGYAGRKHLWLHAESGHNTLDFDSHASWWGEVSNFLLSRPPGR